MDEEAAAALLLKLSAKSSSAILDQMETAKAARLVSVMIGAARPSDKPATSEKEAPRKASAEPPSGGQQEAVKPQDNGKS
jgi:flagellar motility protein MotE (MotC chaperone)